MRRHMVFAAAPACALLLFSPFTAKAAVTDPPVGEARAVAAQVGSIIAISPTHALAKPATPTAEAAVIKLGDQVLLGLGGTQTGDGKKEGVLLDTGANNPIRLEVAPWSAAVDGTSGPTRHSVGEAAVAKLNVANVVKLALLHSKSEATWTEKDKSTGSAFSNGVELGVADVLNIVLLHSEVSSEGVGHSYLIDLNGNEIGTDSSLGQSPLCALTLQSVLALSCLEATGGGAAPGTADAPREAEARVADVTTAVSAISPVSLINASASSGNGAPGVTLPAAPAAPAPADLTAAAEDTRAPDAAAPATLPRTGAAFAGLAVSGLVALLGGALLRLASRRRVTTA